MCEIDLDELTTLEKAKYLVNEHNTHINYDYYDGEQFVYFEIIKIDTYSIDVIVEKSGKIIITEYDLFEDVYGEHYFEYINPYMVAIEQGIITSTTKERLEQLEQEKKAIDERILIEKAKRELPIDKKEVIKYIKEGMTKEPRLMVRQLIDKVILYDDKIEIFFKYTKKPDDNSRASLIFKGKYEIASSSCKYTKHKERLKNDIITILERECYI